MKKASFKDAFYGGDGGIHAASPLMGLALGRLRGLFHRPLDTLPVRQSAGLSHDARALTGSNPFYLSINEEETSKEVSSSLAETVGFEVLKTQAFRHY